MQIIELNFITHEELIERVGSEILDLEEVKEILIDTEFMSKTIEKALDNVITLLKEVVLDIEAEKERQEKGK